MISAKKMMSRLATKKTQVKQDLGELTDKLAQINGGQTGALTQAIARATEALWWLDQAMLETAVKVEQDAERERTAKAAPVDDAKPAS